MHLLRLIVLLSLYLLFFAFSSQGMAQSGISMDGEVKYPKDFKQFEYTSQEAVKGGLLTLHDMGSFDKLNPFSFKGEAPLGVESWVFEPLAVSSLDEPFSLYGLLAKSIELSQDGKSVTFILNENATFSDKTPVTAKDVGYTIDLLRSNRVHPYYNFYYQDITGYDIIDERTIRVNFLKPNRELHLITSQIKIIPARLDSGDFWNSSKTPPVGSGPYVVENVNFGKSITYKRNRDYWAKSHPTRLGMYNYDKITVKYYKDQTIALEAFKAGEFDFMTIYMAKQWARDLKGPKFESGQLVKKAYPHSNNAGMQAFVFNTRKEIFQDRRVRKALGLALDFEWINSSLFHNQYKRNNSFFSNSPLAAVGLPDETEQNLLEPFRDVLPPEVFTEPLTPNFTKDRRGLRNNLLQARKLLSEAGWNLKEKELVNEHGKIFTFDIILVQPSIERVIAAFVKNLKKLGIEVNYRTIDSALYIDRIKKFDFDMMVTSYAQSQSPGNEQRSFWHSESADQMGTRNYAGVKSPVVDSLVDEIIYAKDRASLTAACKALDRVLWYGYYVIPNWYLDVHRLTYTNTFGKPDVLPLYYNPSQLLMTWWIK